MDCPDPDFIATQVSSSIVKTLFNTCKRVETLKTPWFPCIAALSDSSHTPSPVGPPVQLVVPGPPGRDLFGWTPGQDDGGRRLPRHRALRSQRGHLCENTIVKRKLSLCS